MKLNKRGILDRYKRIYEEGLANVEQLQDWARRRQAETEANLRSARLECKHKRDKNLGVCSICGEVMR